MVAANRRLLKVARRLAARDEMLANRRRARLIPQQTKPTDR